MSVSLRPLLVPGVAIAATGALVIGPAVVAPPSRVLAAPVMQVPAVHIEDVQLAGFALDLFNALDGWAQFGVQVIQDFFFWNPGIGTAVANLYATFQPIIEAIVTFIDGFAQGPADIIGTLTNLASSVFGLPLAAAATGTVPASAAASRIAAAPRSAAAEQTPVRTTAVAETPSEPAADV
ncbi:MAG: hypothetical protein ACR2JM_11280, partial [Mycobacterium sp.]